MNKCIFLDRDGVLNEDRVDYAYTLEHFIILPQVAEALQLLKDAGYLLIIITNQSGIAKGIYTAAEVQKCYDYLQENCNYLLDYQYFAPYHPQYDSASLSRKPDSLLIEKAVAKFNISCQKSWFIGDAERDMIAAKKQNLPTVQIISHKPACNYADYTAQNLWDAAQKIISLESQRQP
jgi:D-glycero-D-manno-heptose 1,7-bisphosphate phosphatase